MTEELPPQSVPLLARCIRHERVRVAVAFLAPAAMTVAIFWIASTFGEFGGFRGESAFWPLLAVAILFVAQMPAWSFKFRAFRGGGALTVVIEIFLAVVAGLFALLMFSRDWL
jgi:hypothetical protein